MLTFFSLLFCAVVGGLGASLCWYGMGVFDRRNELSGESVLPIFAGLFIIVASIITGAAIV